MVILSNYLPMIIGFNFDDLDFLYFVKLKVDDTIFWN